ncbi:hypothetical protein BHE74_00027913, partial [Ensete ventricosum]
MEFTGPEHVLVDISSEEEDSGPDRLVSSSFNWVGELHDRVDERQVEESDDVVFVDEFSVPVAKRRKPNSDLYGPGTCGGSDGDDDDCLVLDSVPDNPVAVGHYEYGGGEGEDDLIVVAEKGQVAGTRTARYRAVPPKIDHRRSISTVSSGLREKSTVGSIKGEKGKKKKRKRRKNKRGVPISPRHHRQRAVT